MARPWTFVKTLKKYHITDQRMVIIHHHIMILTNFLFVKKKKKKIKLVFSFTLHFVIGSPQAIRDRHRNLEELGDDAAGWKRKDVADQGNGSELEHV